mgnify:CR=1 FL=1
MERFLLKFLYCDDFSKLSTNFHNNSYPVYILTDKPQGSDLLLEATLEAEVAEHAKSFAQQHHDELRKE